MGHAFCSDVQIGKKKVATGVTKTSSVSPLAGNGDLVRQSRGCCHLSVHSVKRTR